ncbi:hypothetical protein FE257_011399 [Aspergillus nanangensis]|uniref:S-adenosyl-L-methionine-dependent methyltransferase n=1 Tax=Aspergillus nanangensis TaxID=2582783 RepID=A0AAD4CHM4_ASPNN|nr:hypothetical protein FE257_011399 [Aspergillus nanangensis]
MADPSPPKGKLISHFEDRSIQDHGPGWSNLWDTGNSSLWDRGKPSPALIDTIESHQQTRDDCLFHPIAADGRRKRALVPGCGRGYDVVMLALHGFDAYGLEISATAVKEAEAYASAEMEHPRPYNFGQAARATADESSRGTARFVQGDFFRDDWCGDDAKFDLVYDYTFLCALHPTMRRDWAGRMASLLGEGGLLVCLEFPMYKDPSLPGPPWGLNGVHWDLLARGGEGVVSGGRGDGVKEEEEEEEQGSFVRRIYVRPERTK